MRFWGRAIRDGRDAGGMMSNGLANGNVESWQADVALATFKGMVAGKDFSADILAPVVSNAFCPSGKGLQVSSLIWPITIEVGADPLWAGWGATDFMWAAWCLLSDDAGGPYFVVGEGNNDGFDGGKQQIGVMPDNCNFELPGSDGSYPSVTSTGFPVTDSVKHLIWLYWTAATKTLNCGVDNGAPFQVVSAVGAGTPDPTNEIYFSMGGGGTALNQNLYGDMYLWRTTVPAVATVYNSGNGVAISAFDSGGGGGEPVTYYDMMRRT